MLIESVTSTMIQPEFGFLYTWEINQTLDEMDIKISFPETFNGSALKVEYNLPDEITVTLPGQVPVVNTKLYANAKSINFTRSDTDLSISIEKEEPANWPLMSSIEKINLETIDPHSAFDTFIYITSNQLEQYSEIAQALMTMTLEMGYLPALLYGVNVLMDDPNASDTRLMLLQRAAQFNDPQALLMFAGQLSQKPETCPAALQVYQRLAEMGVPLAVSLIGQMFSPLSPIPFEQKDPAVALKYFEMILAEVEEPIALFEAAKLYQEGLGAEKDVKKAQEYYQKAKQLLPQIPDLPQIGQVDAPQPPTPESDSTPVNMAIIGGAITVALVFAFAAYRYVRRHK